jgi:phenylalanyl-tRNA synthetase beta chain
MPIATFSLEYLKRLTTLSPEQLVKQAFDYGLEATLHPNALEVEVTAERPDLLAAEGFTRAMNIYANTPRTVSLELESSGRKITVSPKVQAIRPYIGALIVENVELGPIGLETLIQFQEKVTQTYGRQRKKIAIGLYDLDRIQGDLEYTTASKDSLTFVPLGSGDTALTAQQILTQHPIGLLYAHTLPDGDHVPVLQDAVGTVLSMPPIINAEGVGTLTPDTTRLFLDVTGNGLKAVLEMVSILAHNFLDLGAIVKTVEIETPDGSLTTPDLNPKAIPFSALALNETLGTYIPKADLNRYLDRMDLHTHDNTTVLVPTYRTDIFSETDIAGDLLVAVGIENLVADRTLLQRISTQASDRPQYQFMGVSNPLKDFALEVGDLAQRMGLTEVKSYILTDPDLLARFPGHPIHTDNARSRTYSATRVTLQAGLLEILSRNITAPKPIDLYEIGEVIHCPDSSAIVPDQPSAILESLFWGFASLDARSSFTKAKSYVQTLLKTLRISYQLGIDDTKNALGFPRYIPGRGASVWVQDQWAGHFGEIHPAILEQFSFPEPVCAGELDCQILLQARE